MTEHEKLKNICEIIWYKPKFNFEEDEEDYDYLCYYEYNKWTWSTRIIDVREIIFTTEFMNKFIDYRSKWKIEKVPCESLISTFAKWLIWSIDRKWHLDNPVDYLYNLMK